MPIYRTRAGLYVGTQAAAGKDFDTIDLPRTPAIIDALNAAHEHGYDQGIAEGSKFDESPAVTVTPGNVCDVIMEAQGGALGKIVIAAVERLGELPSADADRIVRTNILPSCTSASLRSGILALGMVSA